MDSQKRAFENSTSDLGVQRQKEKGGRESS